MTVDKGITMVFRDEVAQASIAVFAGSAVVLESGISKAVGVAEIAPTHTVGTLEGELKQESLAAFAEGDVALPSPLPNDREEDESGVAMAAERVFHGAVPFCFFLTSLSRQ